MKGTIAGTPLAISVAFIVVSLACSSDRSGPVEPAGPSFSAPIAMAIGETIGAATYAAGDSSAGGRGGAVQGIGCDTTTPVVHVHAHLTLIADSVQRAIPLAIGIADPVVVSNFVVAARCYYWLHTHDATGIVHLESPNHNTLTLGNFFAIWGQPLTRSNVAGFTGDVTVYVDSTRYDGDLGAIPITAHEQITLIVGGVPAEIPVYQFPAAF